MDRRRLDMVAITDHNTLSGALDFHSRAPGRFIVGEEIKTVVGELIGLFLQEEVPAGLSIQETIAEVHSQGGLVGASHPLDRWRSESIGAEVLEAIHGQLDFVEVLNARMIDDRDNQTAREVAARWGLPDRPAAMRMPLLRLGGPMLSCPHLRERVVFYGAWRGARFADELAVRRCILSPGMQS